LKEIIPAMSRIALLAAPFDPPKDLPYYGRPEQWEVAVRRAADGMNLALTVHRAGNGDELRAAFAALVAQRSEGLVVSNEATLFRIPEIWGEIRRSRVPAVAGFSAFADNGGLLSYGTNSFETNRYAAKFVDLILEGAKPADIPVEQPTRFELVVNLKSAKALGLKIPQSFLLRADRVIE
jgi:putative ABC transport system substrate-binding protein